MRLKRLEQEKKLQKGGIYGRLTLTGKNYLTPMYGQLRRIVEAECECGVTRMYPFSSLQSGETKSCGCFRRDVARERMTTHNLSLHPLYLVHQEMRKRCYIENNPSYPDYGGRGIEICDEWVDDFVCFYDWAVEHGYQSGLSLERRDNDKSYSPTNCYWATRPEQNRNTRRNKMISAFGETKCLFDWGKDPRCVIGVWGLRNRYDRGKWTDMEKMITQPPEDRKTIQRNNKSAVLLTAWGETKSRKDWLDDSRCLVKIDSLRDRLNKGWNAEKAMGTPPSR